MNPSVVERLDRLANALIVLRQGVTLEASENLPPCDPVTVADALEEAKTLIEQQQAQIEQLEMDKAELNRRLDELGIDYSGMREALEEIAERATRPAAVARTALTKDRT